MRADTLDDLELDDTILPEKKKPYTIIQQKYEAVVYHIYLSSGIDDPEKYIELIHTIAFANPDDVIYIHLNCVGGQLDTGVQIINAMRNSPAKVITVLESTAHSLATLIFLSGDEMIVHDNCMMMFHDFSASLIGKGREMKAELDATAKWYYQICKKIYIPFMSQEELDKMMNGSDMWLQSSDIKRRLKRLTKTIKPNLELVDSSID